MFSTNAQFAVPVAGLETAELSPSYQEPFLILVVVKASQVTRTIPEEIPSLPEMLRSIVRESPALAVKSFTVHVGTVKANAEMLKQHTSNVSTRIEARIFFIL